MLAETGKHPVYIKRTMFETVDDVTPSMRWVGTYVDDSGQTKSYMRYSNGNTMDQVRAGAEALIAKQAEPTDWVVIVSQ